MRPLEVSDVLTINCDTNRTLRAPDSMSVRDTKFQGILSRKRTAVPLWKNSLGSDKRVHSTTGADNSTRLYRPRNNSAFPVCGVAQRQRAEKLPPLNLSTEYHSFQAGLLSALDTDGPTGALCPTDYFKRLRQKVLPKSTELTTASQREKTAIPHETKEEDREQDAANLVKPKKLKPVIPPQKHMRVQDSNTSHSSSIGKSIPFLNHSNPALTTDSFKRRLSNFNMRSAGEPPYARSVAISTTGTSLGPKEETAVTMKQSTEANLLDGEHSNSDSLRTPAKLRTNEDTEELVSRDRYLSVMEVLLKKHRGLSIRTPRSPTGVATTGTSIVPSRRIQQLPVVPEDPMMRFTGRHVFHSMGFKMPEKSESLVVEPDHEQICQVAMMRECEAAVLARFGTKSSHVAQTVRPQDAVALSTESTVAAGSSAKTKAEEDFLSRAEFSLDPLDSDTESLGCDTDWRPDPGITMEQTTDQTVRITGHKPPYIDPNRIYFHFNPILQIFPNQTPWRVHKIQSGKAETRPVSNDTTGKTLTRDRKQALEDSKQAGLVDNTTEELLFRPITSAEPVLARSLSTDRLDELRQAVRSIRAPQTSSSSMFDPQNTESLVSDIQLAQSRNQRLHRSASEGDSVGLAVQLRRLSAPLRTDLASPEQPDTTNAELSHFRGPMSVHEIGASRSTRYTPMGQTDAKEGNLDEVSTLVPVETVPMEEVVTSETQSHRKPKNIIVTKKSSKRKETVTTESLTEALNDEKKVDGENEGDGNTGQESVLCPKAKSQCEDVLSATVDPNPMAWFDILDEHFTRHTQRLTVRERLIAQFRLKGLQKHFAFIPQGVLGLQRELDKGWDIRPKPELLMSCVVKHHVLKMPMNLSNPILMEKIYTNSIVRHPVLYKLIMRRREILPQELQQFLNRIMELTETSDRTMASMSSSMTKSTALTAAAKEMDASGFMTGGPKVEQTNRDSRTSFNSTHRPRTSQSSLVSQTGLSLPTATDMMYVDEAETVMRENSAKKDSSFRCAYAKEIDLDKGFYTVLRNPCTNILEDVALHNPEFAWHVRPLFEYRWATLEEDLLEQMNDKRLQLNSKGDPKIPADGNLAPSNSKTTASGRFSQRPETLEYCKHLLERVFQAFTRSESQEPGSRVFMDLLICLHMTNYFADLSDILVKELDYWLPPLLSGLESSYSSVREDTCCILAYLVCSYRLIMRLHVVSKNLLVANICFSVLSAIGQYPESYAFYHGLLGYILHAVPCLSTLDCLLLWLPSVQFKEHNLVSRDWSLFVYYVIRHWPRNPFYLDSVYQKKLLRPLETSYLTKHAKHSARLALSYLVRTCNVRSALLICWPESDEAQLE